jgi:hypothetical protein
LVLAKPIVIMKSILPGTAKMPHASFQRISAGSSNIGGSGDLLARSVVLGLRGELAKPGRFTVADCTGAPLHRLPATLLRSITWTREPKWPRHLTIAPSLGAPVYFCDSRSPWQRGSNENTNGLLRDYFPKGTDLSTHSTQHLLAVQATTTARPNPTRRHQPSDALLAIRAGPHSGIGDELTARHRRPKQLIHLRNHAITEPHQQHLRTSSVAITARTRGSAIETVHPELSGATAGVRSCEPLRSN